MATFILTKVETFIQLNATWSIHILHAHGFAMIDYHSYMAVLIGQGEYINSNFLMFRTMLNRDMHITCRKVKFRYYVFSF